MLRPATRLGSTVLVLATLHASAALAAPQQSCAVPAEARDVVLAVTRHTVPIGRSPVTTGTQITATGTCATDAECVHVPTDALAPPLAQLRALGPLRHTPGGASPHYGGRWVTARWRGGECTLSDGVDAPIAAEDQAAFSALFDAIVAVATAHRKP